MYVCMYVLRIMRMYVCMCMICMYVCVCMCICMCACVCVCACADLRVSTSVVLDGRMHESVRCGRLGETEMEECVRARHAKVPESIYLPTDTHFLPIYPSMYLSTSLRNQSASLPSHSFACCLTIQETRTH